MSYDLLYGRASFLWATLLINKYLGPNMLPHDLLMLIVDAILAGGRAGASVTLSVHLCIEGMEQGIKV